MEIKLLAKKKLGDNLSKILRQQIIRILNIENDTAFYCKNCNISYNPEDFFCIPYYIKEFEEFIINFVCPDCFEKVINSNIDFKNPDENLSYKLLVYFCCKKLENNNLVFDYDKIKSFRTGKEYKMGGEFNNLCLYYPGMFKRNKNGLSYVKDITEKDILKCWEEIDDTNNVGEKLKS